MFPGELAKQNNVYNECFFADKYNPTYVHTTIDLSGLPTTVGYSKPSDNTYSVRYVVNSPAGQEASSKNLGKWFDTGKQVAGVLIDRGYLPASVDFDHVTGSVQKKMSATDEEARCMQVTLSGR